MSYLAVKLLRVLHAGKVRRSCQLACANRNLEIEQIQLENLLPNLITTYHYYVLKRANTKIILWVPPPTLLYPVS